MAARSRLLERLYEVLAPSVALQRAAARQKLDAFRKIDAHVGRELTRRFDGASRGRRTKNWNPTNTSADAETYGQLAILRARSRDLARNNSWAKRAISVLDSDVIGTGITPRFKLGDAKAIDEAASAWAEWAGSEQCDADGQSDLAGLQGLWARTMFESGEVLIRRRWRRAEDGLRIPFQLQTLEPDQLDTTREAQLPNGGEIKQGVEYGPLGDRVAYWIYRRHPGERYGDLTSSRIPARDVIHLFERLRPGQTRGVPLLAPLLILIRDFVDFRDAQLLRMVVGNLYGMFITRVDGDLPGSPVGEDPSDTSNAPIEELSPGTVQYLNPGETVEFSNPPLPQGIDSFARFSLLEIAAGTGVPYEYLTGDLSNVNYSSARISVLLRYSRDVSVLQARTFVPCVRRVWNWMVEGDQLQNRGLLAGALPTWNPQERELIDPAKEVAAMTKMVRSGFKSRERICLGNGEDPDEVLESQARDVERADELGIMLDTNPEDDANRTNPDSENAVEPDDPTPAQKRARILAARTAAEGARRRRSSRVS